MLNRFFGLCALACLFLSGCGDKALPATLQGNWASTGVILQDGSTRSVDAMDSAIWVVGASKIEIYLPLAPRAVVVTYRYSDKAILFDPEPSTPLIVELLSATELRLRPSDYSSIDDEALKGAIFVFQRRTDSEVAALIKK